MNKETVAVTYPPNIIKVLDNALAYSEQPNWSTVVMTVEIENHNVKGWWAKRWNPTEKTNKPERKEEKYFKVGVEGMGLVKKYPREIISIGNGLLDLVNRGKSAKAEIQITETGIKGYDGTEYNEI